MNASDRRALKLITQSKGDVRASLLSFLSKPKHYKKSIQKAREAKEQKERLSKKEETARIREFCFGRAADRCEFCTLNRPSELHHLEGGNGRRRQRQSEKNCVAICEWCHRFYHRDPASFAVIVAAWCAKHGYPPIVRIEHAALLRKSSRALGLGQRVPPSPASSPDARDLPKVIP